MEVAITGIGLVTPLGIGRESTWEGVRAGRSGIGRLHDEEAGGRVWLAARVLDLENMSDPLSSRLPGRLDDDRFVRFALAAADEALSESGVLEDGIELARVGCCIGSSKGGIISLLAAHEAWLRGTSPDPGLIGRVSADRATLRVAERHGLAGPMGNFSAACATGAACIAWGANMIRRGWCDAAVVGSSDASITPLLLAGFHRMGVLAKGADDPCAACKPFDRRRDGFVVGEGAATLVLEKRSLAERRGARIYGVLGGWALGSQAYHEVYPDPTGLPMSRVITLALARARLRPEDIDHVNAHGTGTRAGDAAEVRAIRRAFGKAADSLAVSSTKPQTGHLLGAAGSLEFALALLSIRDGFIPPTLNLMEPDPECDLDFVPLHGRTANCRAVMSLSAGFGGEVAALVAIRT